MALAAPGGPTRPDPFGSKHCYLAFVLTPGKEEPNVVPLGSADVIDTLVSRWREEVASGPLRGGRSERESEAACRAAGEALRRAIWDPLAAHLSGAQRVFIVTDGALHLVNFAALPAGDSDYLVETGPLIHMLSAEKDLVPSTLPKVPGEGLLALGGPDYDATSLFASLGPERSQKNHRLPSPLGSASFRGSRSGCADFASIHFEPLPGAIREADEIARLWKKSALGNHKPRAPSARIRPLTGPRASEAAFKVEAPGHRVLHLATHGFFLGGRCASALESTRGVGGIAAGGGNPPPSMTGENPLVLSGLALAGANYREAAGPDEEDGILTAEEIAALDLSSVEWAVLSACETGVGEVRAGEGVFGLRRAFQVAGAGTLIMSLWAVDDESTREWMQALYEARLARGMGTAEAVREASLSVLRARRDHGESTHPFFWGAFVAAGDWR